jgi:hypothetical protein
MTSSESPSFLATSGSVANANKPTNAGSPACTAAGTAAVANEAIAVTTASKHPCHGLRIREPLKGHLVYNREK